MSHVEWYREKLHQSYCQGFQVDKVLYEQRTEHQELIIFENTLFGRVMALDGIIQTTEKDEFIYHEMFAHMPLFAHPNPKRVLIVGGGDGGLLREVAKHQSIEHITMVEIDASVVEMAKTYLPKHSDGAFDDPRLTLVIADGLAYVQQCDEQFDVILSDSTDPVGPGAQLFTEAFYAGAQRCLKEDGFLVTQNGVSFMQLREIALTHQRLAPLFECHGFYAAAVPTYVGGNMHYAWASPSLHLPTIDETVIAERFAASELATRYYHPGLHRAACCLPQYVQDIL